MLQGFAESGSLDWYKRLTKTSDDKNPANQFGWTPLHSAAQNGQIAVCKFIMENLEDKNPKDTLGITPFDAAAENGHLELCECIFRSIEEHSESEKIHFQTLYEWAVEKNYIAPRRHA